MTIVVTALMSAGEPDPTWTLMPDQEQEFLENLLLRRCPVSRLGRRGGGPGTPASWHATVAANAG